MWTVLELLSLFCLTRLHTFDKVGGTLPFNDLMVGNVLVDQPGIFTERQNGEPVKVGERGNPQNPL